MKFLHCVAAAGAAVLLCVSAPLFAFMEGGCGGGKCAECHTLTREEAAGLLAGAVDNVLHVEPSAVGGLWAVDVVKGGRKWPVYIDFSKNFLISGQVIRLSSRENVTEHRSMRLNAVDIAAIPTGDAVVVGNPKATRKIIEFSDPDCHVCAMQHIETRKVLAKNPDVAFLVKLYSRNNSPKSFRKIRSILCGKESPAKLLDDAFAGKNLPPPEPTCDFGVVQDTARLAGTLNLKGTPALILPDGRVANGFQTAETILKLLEEIPPSAGTK